MWRQISVKLLFMKTISQTRWDVNSACRCVCSQPHHRFHFFHSLLTCSMEHNVYTWIHVKFICQDSGCVRTVWFSSWQCFQISISMSVQCIQCRQQLAKQVAYRLDGSTAWEPEMLAADMRERRSFKIFASTEFSTYNLRCRQKQSNNWLIICNGPIEKWIHCSVFPVHFQMTWGCHIVNVAKTDPASTEQGSNFLLFDWL